LGGNEYETGYAIALDRNGDVYVAGGTESPDFPAVNAFQSYAGEGLWNAFITRFSADGMRLVYSSCLGGNPSFVNGEIAHGIAIDREGNAYIAGESTSPNFPGVNPFQPPQPSSNGFVAKVCPTGCLVYATTLGGHGQDHVNAIAVDASGNAYVVGQTDSTEFPTAFAFQKNHGGSQFDAFMAKVVDVPLSLSTLTLDLGDIPLSHQSKPQAITLTNTGSADLKIESIEKKETGAVASSSSCGAFAISGPQLPFTIPAAGKRDLSVVFTPAADADYDCFLQIGVAQPLRAMARTKLLGIGSGLVSVKIEYSYVYQGGNAEFSLKFTNPTSQPLQFDLYLFLMFPNGPRVPLMEVPIALSGDQAVKIEEIKLPIPATAPTGKYTLGGIAARSDTGFLCVSTAEFTVNRPFYVPPKQ
jgi:hypothetical protein